MISRRLRFLVPVLNERSYLVSISVKPCSSRRPIFQVGLCNEVPPSRLFVSRQSNFSEKVVESRRLAIAFERDRRIHIGFWQFFRCHVLNAIPAL